MAAAAAGLAVWALFATPASAVPVGAGDIPVAGIADGGYGTMTGVDPVRKIVAIDPYDAGVADGGGDAGERAHAQAARKPRCLWRQRECHPPANLWYRVAVAFDGQLTFRLQPALRGVRACVPCSPTSRAARVGAHRAGHLAG